MENKMKNISKVLFGGFALALIGAGAALAVDNGGPVDQALASKIIGEQANGYLGFVKPAGADQGDLQRQINEINARRRAVYTDVANKTGGTVDQAATVQAMRQIQKLNNGEYLKDLSGAWCAKSPATKASQAADNSIIISCK